MSDFPQVEKKIEKHTHNFEGELHKIRGGRAHASIIEDILVDYYGSKQSIKAIGTISMLDSQTLTVEPWDKNALEPIASAISKAQNGLQAVVEGERVRIPFPPLSEERRKEFIRFANKKAEEAKISLRRLRDDEMKELKQQENISKDDFFRTKDKLEKLFKKYFDKIDELREKKEKELATV